ncbi:hypothetical protein G7Y89_g14699 [Cudoniella acicularis]|uniref:O-methyltransferase domain-containing protein n=1 Tax=Cudoniella acicularis TaxID=354080 RepID=A0A8H4QZL2_9HELO|nr:hypothetical protein G7Y89_g14699 [Cudoniella acicularis]
MEILTALLLLWPYIVALTAVYFGTLIFYRLFLHPLAKFPGPKLAAITRYYEAYYDIVQNGQYIFKIEELHKKYGPIIRISPYELHIMDSAYYEKLYRQEGRWEKYSWAYDAFGVKDSIISTGNHELHKARRQPLNAFFSKAKVANQQDLIRRNLRKLCDRLSKVSGSKRPINLGAALSAFTRDVSTEFIIGKSYNDLDHEDFNIALTNMTTTGFGHIWRMTKHITWFGPAMKAIPIDWAMKMANDDTKAFLSMLKASHHTKELMAAATSPNPDEKTQRTIVHEIMDSGLPPSDKSFERVSGDLATVTSAGFETTSSALRLIFYHVFSKPEILQRLRAELATVRSSDGFEWRTLEQLPYLTSILMEGLRMSPGVVSRLARIAPDRDIIYKEGSIPAGTPVGMSILTLHMDETLYPDPRCFDPDRWMDLEVRKKADKVFAPFSKGTRMCIGMYLAWAEMYLVLATLVQQFNFEFDGASAKNFICSSDDFSPGTKGASLGGEILAHVMHLGLLPSNLVPEIYLFVLTLLFWVFFFPLFEMEAIFSQIKQIASTAGNPAKKSLIFQLHALAYSLEEVDDTVKRLSHLNLEAAVIRIGVDLKLFDLLSTSQIPLSVNKVVKSTGGDAQLIGRLMRFLASISVIEETGKDTFTSTNVSRNLTVPGSQAGFCHGFETSGPLYQELPSFLKRTRYQTPTNPTPTVLQSAYNFPGTAFEWFGTQPENLKYYQEYMAGRRQLTQEMWFSVYPVSAETEGLTDPENPLLVNIGGNIGHSCTFFKENFPDIPGRIILQDLAENIAVALKTKGVENMVYNFFEPQPIRGAKYYYIAHVLHDWPTSKCLEILQNIKAAMNESSVILIDEMVLPDTGVPSSVTTIDLEMMCAHASQERTQSQWDELLGMVGLKCLGTWEYNSVVCESVMKVVLV